MRHHRRGGVRERKFVHTAALPREPARRGSGAPGRRRGARQRRRLRAAHRQGGRHRRRRRRARRSPSASTRTSSVQPDRAHRGSWADGDGEVVIDAGDGGGRGLRGRRRDRHRRARARYEQFDDLRHRAVPAAVSRSAAPRSPSSRSRQLSGSSTRRASSTRSRSPPRRASRPSSSSRRSSRSSRRTPRCVPGEQETEEAQSDIEEFTNIIRYFLLAFGFIAPVRRRVRHLQHALDHGRPARARVRDAAHGRRVAPAGARLGHSRGARDRAARVGHRALRRARAGRGADGAASTPSGSTCRRRAPSSRPARSIVSLCSA